jgi:hypothetical protein
MLERFRRTEWLVVFALVALLCLVNAWGFSWSANALSASRWEGTTIFIPSDVARRWMWNCATASFVVALAAFAAWVVFTTKGRWLIAASGLVLVPSAYCGAGMTMGWGDDDSLSGVRLAPVGDAHCLRAWSGWWNPDELHAVVAHSRGDFFGDDYRVHARQWVTDERFSSAPVLAPDGHGDFVISRTTGLAASFTHGACALVWDSNSKCALWDGRPRGTIRLLALLEPDDAVDSESVADLVRHAEWDRANAADAPRRREPFVAEDQLLAARNDPRPSVRAAVEAIVAAGGPAVYPNAARPK